MRLFIIFNIGLGKDAALIMYLISISLFGGWGVNYDFV